MQMVARRKHQWLVAVNCDVMLAVEYNLFNVILAVEFRGMSHSMTHRIWTFTGRLTQDISIYLDVSGWITRSDSYLGSVQVLEGKFWPIKILYRGY